MSLLAILQRYIQRKIHRRANTARRTRRYPASSFQPVCQMALSAKDCRGREWFTQWQQYNPGWSMDPRRSIGRSSTPNQLMGCIKRESCSIEAWIRLYRESCPGEQITLLYRWPYDGWNYLLSCFYRRFGCFVQKSTTWYGGRITSKLSCSLNGKIQTPRPPARTLRGQGIAGTILRAYCGVWSKKS
jgi:hypothetical protein